MSLRDDVLDRTDIVDLVSRYVDLKKVGKNRSGLCPFHREKSPSFTVAEDKQIFKCFGCGKGGNAITFHMEIERIDFLDTLKILAQDANLDIKEIEYDPKKSAERKEHKEKFKYLNKRAQKFFADNFEGSEAANYAIDKRKLSENTISTFGIGYAKDSHYDLVTTLKEKGFTHEDIIKAGLAKKGNSGDTYAFFRHRLTFPIHDHIGNIVGFGARALTAEQSPKYLNTTETPLYDKSKILFGLNHAREVLKERDILIVVEGYMDVIALYQYGFPIGVATCGTALTPQHAKLIRRHTDRVIFAFDNDAAGFQATLRGLKAAYAQDLFPKVLQFPSEYKDVDEWLTEKSETRDQKPEEAKTFLKEHSVDGFTYVLRALTSEYDLMNPVERKKVLSMCFDILEELEDWTILSLYLDQMSTPFGTGTDILLQQFKGFLKKKKKTSFQKIKEEKEGSVQIASKYLLASLWRHDFIDPLLSYGKLKGYVEIIETLSNYFPGSLIASLKSDDIDDTDQQKLMEAQLWWEHQFGSLADDKKAGLLERFLQQQIHTLERVVLKSKKISDAQKQEIIEKVRGLKK